MKFSKITFPYLLLFCAALSACPADAQNTVVRKAELIDNYPDTFRITLGDYSNTDNSFRLNIYIDEKGRNFNIDSVYLVLHDSILRPVEPFSMTCGDIQSGDSIVKWEFSLTFPYRAAFFESC
ncbi:MAG: hypothetical protein K2H84_05660, partial [Paramuribaculum sp.]|nr:hypothetical protein [Paramuribaculum sp.]